MVFFVLKGGEYALRYLRYKQLSRKIVKMSLVDKELTSRTSVSPSSLNSVLNSVGSTMSVGAEHEVAISQCNSQSTK
jgi:hypothetical protein